MVAVDSLLYLLLRGAQHMACDNCSRLFFYLRLEVKGRGVIKDVVVVLLQVLGIT